MRKREPAIMIIRHILTSAFKQVWGNSPHHTNKVNRSLNWQIPGVASTADSLGRSLRSRYLDQTDIGAVVLRPKVVPGVFGLQSFDERRVVIAADDDGVDFKILKEAQILCVVGQSSGAVALFGGRQSSQIVEDGQVRRLWVEEVVEQEPGVVSIVEDAHVLTGAAKLLGAAKGAIRAHDTG